MIQIRNLSKTYRSGFLLRPRKVLHAVNLDVYEGEIFGFIGPNGAGKSTTIKLLLGLLRPASGEIRVLGGSPLEIRVRSQIGYLPEHPYFYEYLTGRELLTFFGNLCGLRGSLLKERIDWALNLVHANKDWIDRRLRTYSKGMMQRVGLAQAVLQRPRLLILDEPMSGLDPLGRRDVRQAILELNKMGTTIFYSSHVLSDVETLSHRVAMIVEGKIARQGSVAEVTGEARREYKVFTERSVPEEVARGIADLRVGETGEYLCADASVKDRILQACAQWGIPVERVEYARPSLEDVLAQEVAKEGAYHD